MVISFWIPDARLWLIQKISRRGAENAEKMSRKGRKEN